VPGPRILFVSPVLPWPPDRGGRQRAFNALAALAGVGTVELICYPGGAEQNGSDMEPLRRLCRRVHLLPEPRPRWAYPEASYRGVLERFVLARRPSLIEDFNGAPLARRAAELGDGADLIWVVRLWTAEWLAAHRDRMIVDVDDLESVKTSRHLALKRPGPWRLAAAYDNRRLRALERSAPARYPTLVLASEADRAFFPAHLRDRLWVMPNGVADHLLALPPAPDPEPAIVFVGTMTYFPNQDAARWLALDIFPRVRAVVPEARLYLVGHDPRGALRDLHDGRRIVVTGRVEDVTPYVRRAAVSAAPIRVGAGTRIKILEALALGVPVVSTTVGAEGLDLAPGQDFLQADTAQEFADAVVHLLKDPAARAALGRRGRARVASRHLWGPIGQGLAERVQGWLARRQETAGSSDPRLAAGRLP
jgi:glycosyltransferase involved in cell wall biosynthesis